jgi:putative transposase
MNRLFTGWVETVYNQRAHTETGEAPLARFTNHPCAPQIPTPAALSEAFLWSEKRRVTKTATVSLHRNIFQVDATLVGQTVECVFDPFDLTSIEIRYQNRPMGQGIPHQIGRHTHPMAKPEPPAETPATGIDFLALLADTHETDLNRLAPPTLFSELVETSDPDQMPGQLQLPTNNPNPDTDESDRT